MGAGDMKWEKGHGRQGAPEKKPQRYIHAGAFPYLIFILSLS